MFVELRGKFDEVPRRRRARKHRILGIGKHAMQGVAEFVEHSGHIVEAISAGSPGAGLLKLATL